MFHRILVGVDGSPAAWLALERAIQLAREGNGRIGLLASAPEPASVIWAGPVAVPQSRSGMCAQLDNWACRCIESALAAVPGDVPVTKLMTRGDPARSLTHEAGQGDWDLVVVGQASRRRRLPFQRPVGERLRDVEVPVLVVHAEPESGPGARASRRRLWSRRPKTGLERLSPRLPVE